MKLIYTSTDAPILDERTTAPVVCDRFLCCSFRLCKFPIEKYIVTIYTRLIQSSKAITLPGELIFEIASQ